MRARCFRAALAVFVGCSLLATACPSGPQTVTPYRNLPHEAGIFFLGNLADETIAEASGMAASRRRGDLLWVINDSGNGPLLHAVGLNGANLGRVRILNARNRDWEDLAAFVYDGRPYLLIADCGDNESRRKSCFIYVVEEPPVGPNGLYKELSVPLKERIEYIYGDGPRDCEGVAVDADNRRILLLTKRNVPPVVYTLPLFSSAKEGLQVAHSLGTVNGIPAPDAEDMKEDPIFGRFRSQPTAMDISPDGKRIAVLTYKRPYLFSRHEGEDWSRVFGKPPIALPMPRLNQAEAMCFSADGSSLFVTSEKRPAPLYRLDIKP